MGGGTLCPSSALELVLDGAAPASLATLVLGTSELSAPFKGGVLVPNPDVLVGALPTGSGGFTIALEWPGAPSGYLVAWQVWIVDGSAPFGLSGSNGVTCVAP